MEVHGPASKAGDVVERRVGLDTYTFLLESDPCVGVRPGLLNRWGLISLWFESTALRSMSRYLPP